MNKLLKILGVVLVGVMMSGYFFPVSFTFLPETLNTKMMLAVLGVFLWIVNSSRTKSASVPRSLVFSIALAALFSIICLYAAEHSGTNDYSYASYIVSFFVWLFGAFAVCFCIKGLHGRVSLRLVTAYLAAVCVFQCVSALLIDNSPAFSAFVDRIFYLGQQYMHEKKRLYGIGAALDSAGCRFAIVEIMIAHILATDWDVRKNGWRILFYFTSFLFILVVGDMIARTTIVGVAMGIVYFILARAYDRGYYGNDHSNFYWIALFLIVSGVIIVTTLYNSSPSFHKSMRFAFEGFFNWVETGVWSTGSTDKLNAEMWIWPKTRDAWIWGTGLFGDFIYSTDIGYCRFILYCGIVGFSAFCAFFIQNAWSLGQRQPELKLLSLFLLALTFIIWVKVATDIFLIYALLYHLDSPEAIEKWEEEHSESDDDEEDESAIDEEPSRLLGL